MGRHAGFAVAASVGEAFINQTIWAAFEDLGPIQDSLLFALPSSVPVVGGSTVQLSGVALFEQRPTIALRENPANTAMTMASAVIYVAANIDSPAGPSFDQTWKLRVSGTASVSIDVEVAADGVFLRWVPASSSISALAVSVLEGPGVPSWLVQALNSPQVLAAMNRGLGAIGPIRVSGKLLDRTITHVQPVKIPSVQLSLFEWFTISETVSRVDLRVKDSCVAIGIDLQGRTNGDANQLLDLRRNVGDSVVYDWPIFDNTGTDRPVLVGVAPTPRDDDIAVLANADVLSAIGASVSGQIAGTPVAPGVKLVSIGLRIERFNKPLRGPELGLRFDFTVHHDVAGDLSGHVYLQIYQKEDRRGTANPVPPVWLMYVGLVEFDVPWWVDVAVVVAGLGAAACFPAIAPLVPVATVAAIDGIIPGVIGSVEAPAALVLGDGVVLAPGVSQGTLPTNEHESTWQDVNRIALASDGVGAQMAIVADSLRFGTGKQAEPTATLHTGFVDPYPFNFRAYLELRTDLMPLANDCTVQIIVSRTDTGAEVARTEGDYRHRFVAFSHLTEDLYLVDKYHLRSRIWLNRESMTGLLFASDVDVPVTGPGRPQSVVCDLGASPRLLPQRRHRAPVVESGEHAQAASHGELVPVPGHAPASDAAHEAQPPARVRLQRRASVRLGGRRCPPASAV